MIEFKRPIKVIIMIKKKSISETIPSLTESIKDNIGLGGKDSPGLSYVYLKSINLFAEKVDANNIPDMVNNSSLFFVQTLSGSTNLPGDGKGVVLNINRKGGSLFTITQIFMSPRPYIRYGQAKIDFTEKDFSEWLDLFGNQ